MFSPTYRRQNLSVNPIDPIYLPFPVDKLEPHLAKADKALKPTIRELAAEKPKGVSYYLASAARYQPFHPDENHKNVAAMRGPRQIEKDERFWTAACFLKLHGQTGLRYSLPLLEKCFGEKPPLDGVASWDEVLREKMELLLQAPLPSPKGYTDWLRQNQKAPVDPVHPRCRRRSPNCEPRRLHACRCSARERGDGIFGGI